jgi:hypothetical protein
MKNFLFSLGLVLTLCLSVHNSFSQTGPGGIGNSTTNPFWVDAHSMNLSNGSAVSSWTDLSGNGTHAVQSTPTAKPTIDAGAINGRDALNFNGSQFLTAGANANLNNKTYINFYMFGNVNNPSLLSLPMNLDYGVVAADAAFTGFISQSGTFSSYARKSPTTLIKTAFSTSSGYNLYEGVYNKTGNQLNSQTNFSLTNTNNNVLRSALTHQEIWIGGTNSFGTQHYFMDGQIAELFIFTFVLNSAQEKILENYISAKYGVATSNDMYSFQSTHGLGVIGIGQDNAGSSHTDSQGNGIVRINSPSALGDGEYLFTGHTDVDADLLSFNVPDALPAGARLERTWQVEKTGDLGLVTLIYDLDGTTNFSADPNNYRLLVNSSDDFSGVIDQVLTGTYSAVDETVTFLNVNLSTGDFYTLAGDAPEDIHSITSGPWNNPNTWDCSCVPTTFNSVFIEATHDVSVDANAKCYDLTLDPAGTLTMSVPATDLDINGIFDLYGTLVATEGQISFTGNVEQYVDAAGNTVEFNDLLIDNTHPLGFTFYQSEYILNGTLYPNQGDIIIENVPGNSFIVNSVSATEGGRIAAISGSATITGDVVVRRFIQPGVADWRDISSPITNGTVLTLDNQMSISGEGFPDGCAYGTGGCFYSVRQYVNNQYVNVTSVTAPLVSGSGYQVFFGDDLTTFSGITLDYRGTILDNSDHQIAIGSGWNIQGNPYPSPITFTTLTKSHVGNYYYIYDSGSGALEYYDGSDGSSSSPELANGIIATGQGFWTYDWGWITFKETDKTAATATFVKSQTDVDLSLYLTISENNSTYHSTMCIQENIATLDGVDSTFDIRHFTTGFEKAPSIAAYSGEDLIRKNYIKDDFRNKSFDLYTKILNQGYHTIEAVNLENFTNYRKVLLFDNVTGEFIDLKKELAYTFYSDVFEGHRFTLVLTNEELEAGANVQSLTTNNIELESESMTITQMGNSFNVDVTENLNEDSQIKLVNVLGQTEVYSSTIRFVQGSNIITVPAELKGVHILIITTGDKIVTKKVVL